MTRIEKELKAGKYSVLILSSELPSSSYTKIKIDGKEYETTIVYDSPRSIAIISDEVLTGKEVEFC